MAEESQEVPTSLFTRAKLILCEKGYTKDCYPLRELAAIIEKNEKLAKRKVFYYKWPGFSLLLLIPLISGLLSFLLAMNDHDELFVLPLSLSLTILTILNSIFRPVERFRTACIIEIKISHFKSDFLSELEKKTEITDASLLECVDQYRKLFERYQEQLIGLFLPETTCQPNGKT